MGQNTIYTQVMLGLTGQHIFFSKHSNQNKLFLVQKAVETNLCPPEVSHAKKKKRGDKQRKEEMDRQATQV